MDLIKRKKEKQEKGIALVIAIILIGVSLMVSIGVSDIFLKEFSFSVFNQKSNKAFYAADSGMECASYWDITGKIFLAPSDVEANYGGILPNSVPAPCLGENINDTWYYSGLIDDGTNYSYSLIFDLSFNDNRCVKISVKKEEVILTGAINTIIESYGYDVGINTDDSNFSNLCGSNLDYPNREERVLKSTSI